MCKAYIEVVIVSSRECYSGDDAVGETQDDFQQYGCIVDLCTLST